MKIHLATDHAGFELKEIIQTYLEKLGYETVDHGAHELNDDDDYPDLIEPAAMAVAESDGEGRGIIFGGSGQGEAMVANRIPGVRATVYYGGSKEIIRLSREHNNANILSVGVRFVQTEELMEVIEMWLKTDFPGDERHSRRIEKLG